MERSHEILTPIGEKASSRSPVLETHTRTVAYENGDDYLNANASDVSGELISSKAVTTGNRTVETLTVCIVCRYRYKHWRFSTRSRRMAWSRRA